MFAFTYLEYPWWQLYMRQYLRLKTWVKCSGDAARYRIPIEADDILYREVWTGVSRQRCREVLGNAQQLSSWIITWLWLSVIMLCSKLLLLEITFCGNTLHTCSWANPNTINGVLCSIRIYSGKSCHFWNGNALTFSITSMQLTSSSDEMNTNSTTFGDWLAIALVDIGPKHISYWEEEQAQWGTLHLQGDLS